MFDVEKLTKNSRYGRIRAICHSDINLLMSDMIDEDIAVAKGHGYSSHIEMIAKTVLVSTEAYSLVDPDERFCSAFGVVPVKKQDSALIWLLSCNNFKKNYNNLSVSKQFLDLSKKVLDEINKKYKYIICNVESGNSHAIRRTKLMGFRKTKALGKVDEYTREARGG